MLPDEIEVKEITAKQLKELLASPTPPLVLDVREPRELIVDGVIEGSTHIPMMQIPNRLGELPKDRMIVAQCAHGNRSYDVAAYLLMNGFKDAASLEGGIVAWKSLK
jgi:rhodanese-related sulfurtransferase